MVSISAGFARSLRCSSGFWCEEQHAAADGVARGVVAADDEQDEVAEELARRHVPRRLGVRHHGDQVRPRLGVHPLVPEVREVGEALGELLFALLLVLDQAARHREGGRAVRPVGELAAVLEGEVEQRRQHLHRQLDGDAVHPIEGLAARQPVQDAADALADDAFQLRQVVRRDDGLHRLALLVVPRRVHRDEHRQLELGRAVADGDAAVGRVRGQRLVRQLRLHDVVVLGYGPVRAEQAFRCPVDRVLLPQAAEVGHPDVVPVERGIAHVQLVERQAPRQQLVVRVDRGVHGRSSFSSRRRAAVSAALRAGAPPARPARR